MIKATNKKNAASDTQCKHISPIIGIVCCHKIVDEDDAQVVKDSYIHAIKQFGGTPILLPAVLADNDESLSQLLGLCDGILLTGSYSNVSPHWYGGSHQENYTDLGRDTLSFKLIEYARNNQMPLLAVCRGHQELNVVYGGVLHPDYRVAGFSETHLYPENLPKENEYQPIHDLLIDENTLLGDFMVDGKNQSQWQVNSLHNQCISQIGNGLQVMAVAPDGLIEAIYDPKHTFMVGVQWHPEGCVDDELSQFLFKRLISACQKID